VIDGHAEPAPSAPERSLPDPGTQAGQALARMQSVEPGFSARHFLDGAEQAFNLIVTAFAAGDRVALRPLLSDDTYRAFEGAIAAREAEGHTQRTEIRSMRQASIEAAELRGHMAEITVRFVTEQINITLGRDREPVAGTDALTELVDLWTFERELRTPDPSWRLAAARSA
jgi:predicted lipid-binding transport protein (Tim44 family)